MGWAMFRWETTFKICPGWVDGWGKTVPNIENFRSFFLFPNIFRKNLASFRQLFPTSTTGPGKEKPSQNFLFFFSLSILNLKLRKEKPSKKREKKNSFHWQHLLIIFFFYSFFSSLHPNMRFFCHSFSSQQ